MKMLHLAMIASCIFFHSGILHRQLRRWDLPAGQNAGQQSRQQRLLREEHQAGWIWPPRNRNSRTRYSWAHAAPLFFMSASTQERTISERERLESRPGWETTAGADISVYSASILHHLLRPFSCLSGPVYVFKVFLLSAGAWPLHPFRLHWCECVLPQTCLPSSLWGRGPRGRNHWRGPT